MTRKKTGLLVLAIVLLGIQFIQPVRNQNGQVLAVDISRIYKVPDKVLMVLKNSCYDCHSNNTIYPWYAHIQPLRYMLDRHIAEGKETLNFSEFGTYSARKKRNKWRAISNSLIKGTMPISSYLLIHRKARLTDQDTAVILNWIRKINEIRN